MNPYETAVIHGVTYQLVPQDVYFDLMLTERKMNYLEAAGISNWDGYWIAMEDMANEDEYEYD